MTKALGLRLHRCQVDELREELKMGTGKAGHKVGEGTAGDGMALASVQRSNDGELFAQAANHTTFAVPRLVSCLSLAYSLYNRLSL